MSFVIEFSLPISPHPLIPEVDQLTHSAISTLTGSEFVVRETDGSIARVGIVNQVTLIADGHVVRLNLSEAP